MTELQPLNSAHSDGYQVIQGSVNAGGVKVELEHFLEFLFHILTFQLVHMSPSRRTHLCITQLWGDLSVFTYTGNLLNWRQGGVGSGVF